MAFSNWKIGLDIQVEGIAAVAVSPGRRGWRLRRWWHFASPLQAQTGATTLPATLADWRRQLPLGAQLRVSFPGLKTLQRTLPREPAALSETQRVMYLAGVMGQQLRMNAAELQVDYCVGPAGEYAVTAARRHEVDMLLAALRQVGLMPEMVTPDACALGSLLAALCVQPRAMLIHRAGDRWLWADTERWGVLPVADAQTPQALCQRLEVQTKMTITSCKLLADKDILYVDPWRSLTCLQPPLPEDGDRFAVALGLALARWPR
ncbi:MULTISPECIES: pilus assembly protein [Tenebrionibacter/Tenebrionicola group]|jgi:pilus assembly protein HofM|uniref:Pilus assembly protein n=2 Tax=Tenebrionibacter/Tenebrionicola group TaxID=2969848 RepID=A0A8K0V634_9ENTR|nr:MULTISPECIES: pilus assembly protein [Tenebrionibacter/Tenebrionicola group]MBK4716083.1 pilus assembly protein [Tenebrionibacter intestinalis]MBV5095988.1 pilus assembly protein [Tenebrionicola larvae]